MSKSQKYFMSFVQSATAEQLARFVFTLANRPAYRVPVALAGLIESVNRELIARTEWSV